jgi:hypothetical protein
MIGRPDSERIFEKYDMNMAQRSISASCLKSTLKVAIAEHSAVCHTS